MLNRRHLRIKILQALYAFFQAEDHDLPKAEKVLHKSVQDIYTLFLHQVHLLVEVHFEALKEREEARKKFRPSAQDLRESTPFTANRIIETIRLNESYQKALTQHKVSWNHDRELVRKYWKKLRSTEEYQTYVAKEETTRADDLQFVLFFYETLIFEDEFLEGVYEEMNIHWIDDLYVVNPAVEKLMRDLGNGKAFKLPKLFKDTDEDQQFMIDLFRKTIVHAEEFQEKIQSKAQNWEAERIAVMDLILMKMALTELVDFPGIPVKVSLNEYIEISKSFSTPKSNAFINGILDKLAVSFRAEGRIQKTGRGLMDNKTNQINPTE
jgi:N utilization substance protein B